MQRLEPDILMNGLIHGARGLIFVGVLVGGLPALGVLLFFVWPSLLILNRGLKMKSPVAVGVTWIIAMGVLAMVALFAPERDPPMWQWLLTPMVGVSFGALVFASFSLGAESDELDIPWRRA